jgi:hypothetical protein
MEENKKGQEPKKKTVKKAKKPVKLTIKEEMVQFIGMIEKFVKDERGKSLNTSSCARFNRAVIDLKQIVRNLSE